MSHIELRLFAAMAEVGDFSPVTSGQITEKTLRTSEAKMLLNFALAYRETEGRGMGFPTRATIEARFAQSGLELPEVSQAEKNGIEQLAHEVRTHAFRADLRLYAQELALISDSPDPRTEAENLLQRFRHNIDGLMPQQAMSIRDALPDIVEDYVNGGLITDGIPWRWPTLQEATRGLHKQQLVILAGRPKQRKTFVAIAQAMYSVMMGLKVLFVSPEMPNRQVMNRAVATAAEVRYSELKNGMLPPDQEERFMDLAHAYDEVREGLGEFWVVQGVEKPVSWIETEVERYQPDLLVVDSLYRLGSGTGSKREADWKVVTAISRGLKDLAMTAEIPILAVHQLNRAAEDKVATTANLALADAVGQDADLILQVMTRRRAEGDESALVVLDGRETDSLGVVIKNVPCQDFSEVGPIVNMKTVNDFYSSQIRDEEEDDVVTEESAKRQALKRKLSNNQTPRSAALKKIDKVVNREAKRLPAKTVFEAFNE